MLSCPQVTACMSRAVGDLVAGELLQMAGGLDSSEGGMALYTHKVGLWYGKVWCHSLVWYGMVWYGMVWYGMVWYGMVWKSPQVLPEDGHPVRR